MFETYHSVFCGSNSYIGNGCMKKTIATLIAAVILSGGIYLTASDALLTSEAIVEPHSDVLQTNAPQAIEQSYSSATADLQIFLLFAIGMVGLACISRSSNDRT